MKKWLKYIIPCLAIILVALICLLLIPRDRYQIVQDKNQYYLKVDGNYEYILYPYVSIDYLPTIRFDSISEMKQTIMEGNLTDEQIDDLVHYGYSAPYIDTPGPTLLLPIIDLSNLYEARCPSSFTDYTISWNVYYYGFSGVDANGIWFSTIPINQARYYDELNNICNRIAILKENTRVIVEDIYTEPDRGATVCCYRVQGINPKHEREVIYSITNGNDVMWIRETYDVDISDTKPYYVDIVGSSNDQFYTTDLSGFKDSETLPYRPSVEWLSQFGIQKYEG